MKLLWAQREFYTRIGGDIEGIVNVTVVGTERILY